MSGRPVAWPDDAALKVTAPAATLRHLVEERLRDAILWGRFPPGHRLIERELCQLTGVGRTSIREALRQLEAEGLVESVPHRGPAVARIDAEEARQLYELRALLEGHAGRRFAERARRGDLAGLDAALAGLRAAARKRDGRALLAAKAAFYEALLRGGGNGFVEKALTQLHNRIALLRLTTMTQPGRLRRSLAEIAAIRDAIAAGDATAAERACVAHVEAAAAIALALLRTAEARSG